VARVSASCDPLAEVYEIAQSPAHVGRLVDDLLDILVPEDRRAILQLAHLPLLSPSVANAVTGLPGLLARTVAAGLPMAEGPGGWARFADPVSEHLRDLGPPEPATYRAASQAYLAAGEPLVAVTTLLAGGQAEEAAGVLAGFAPRQLERLGAAEVRAVVRALPVSALRIHPRALLHQARLSELSYRAQERREALSRCRDVAVQTGDASLLREVTAELALDLVREGAVQEAVPAAQQVLEEAGPDELSARARALDCLARSESIWGVGSPVRAAELLREAAAVSVEAGHAAWAAGLLVRLAQDVLYAECRHEEAVAAIDEALELLAGRPRLRAVPLIIRAEPLRELGRHEQARAAVGEARELGRLYHDDRALAYAAWEDMLMAAQCGDPAACVAAAGEVEHRKGAWFDGPTGVEYLAEAADAFDRVGYPERAARLLTEARSRRGAGDDHDLAALEALVTARSGDPAQGRDLVDRALLRPGMPPRLAWRLRLLGAYADHRLGNPSAALSAVAAFEFCAELGVPELPVLVELGVAEVLVPVAAAAASPSARKLLGAAATVTIHLLGRFEVLRAGRSVTVPPGRPAAALKMLAIRGRMPTDELVELLWPDGDPVAGRARLRNVLSRVRSAAGDVLVREEETVALSSGVSVDAGAFETEARQALALVRDDRRQAVTVARAALARYQGPLAADDPYEDWAAAPRERLRALHLDLLDLLATEAEREEQPDEAVRLLMAAIDEQPYDEDRYRRAARLLLSQGRVGSARAIRARAERMLSQIGISLSFEV
jgi:DNA-binding SARP family transcriptional activator